MFCGYDVTFLSSKSDEMSLFYKWLYSIDSRLQITFINNWNFNILFFFASSFQSTVHVRCVAHDFFTAARMASWNTSSRHIFFNAEHSIRENALIFCLSFFPSWNVTNFSEFGILRSLFVPEIIKRWIKGWFLSSHECLSYWSLHSIAIKVLFSKSLETSDSFQWNWIQYSPTRMIGTFGAWCRTSGTHIDTTLAKDVLLDIE